MKIKIAMLSLLLVSAPMLASAQPKTYAGQYAAWGSLIGAGVGGGAALTAAELALDEDGGCNDGFFCKGDFVWAYTVMGTLGGAGLGALTGAIIGGQKKREPAVALEPFILPTKEGVVAGLNIGKSF